MTLRAFDPGRVSYLDLDGAEVIPDQIFKNPDLNNHSFYLSLNTVYSTIKKRTKKSTMYLRCYNLGLIRIRPKHLNLQPRL